MMARRARNGGAWAALIAATLAATAVVLLAMASPAATKPTGSIAFVRGGRVYTIDPAGSGLRGVRMRSTIKPACIGAHVCTKTIAWWSPSWSTDTKRLALGGSFENGLNDGDHRLYIREASGRTRPVFESDVGTGGVSWSPDGLWLAHDSGRDDPQLILVNVRTHKDRSLRRTGVNAAWSPDGTTLAFRYARGYRDTDVGTFPIWGGIATVRRDGTGFTPLTRSGDSPDWSSDGKKIAYADHGIRIVDLHGKVVQLTKTGTTPSWSADDARIVYQRGNDLWIMSPNGRGQRLLVKNGHDPDWSSR